MDRVSGWFKRKARLCLIVVAAVVCVILNADSVMVGKMLWHDKELRASVVEQAKQYQASPAEERPQGSDAFSTEKTQEVADALSPFPLGWTFPPAWRECLAKSGLTNWLVTQTSGQNDPSASRDPREIPVETVKIVLKVIGLFFTTLAISLGAPFWTDLLNSFVNLRRTGKVPAKATEGTK